MDLKSFLYNEKVLYDSCDIYARQTIENKYNFDPMHPFACSGDKNILELCNRCPYFNPDYGDSYEKMEN